MSWKEKLPKLFLCLILGLSTMSGATVDPQQIEEQIRLMNQTRIEMVIPDTSGDDKPE